jgi:hypothetical protein
MAVVNARTNSLHLLMFRPNQSLLKVYQERIAPVTGVTAEKR